LFLKNRNTSFNAAFTKKFITRLFVLLLGLGDLDEGLRVAVELDQLAVQLLLHDEALELTGDVDIMAHLKNAVDRGQVLKHDLAHGIGDHHAEHHADGVNNDNVCSH